MVEIATNSWYFNSRDRDSFNSWDQQIWEILTVAKAITLKILTVPRGLYNGRDSEPTIFNGIEATNPGRLNGHESDEIRKILMVDMPAIPVNFNEINSDTVWKILTV